MVAVTYRVQTWGMTPPPVEESLQLRFVPSGAAVSTAAVYPARDEIAQPGADGRGTVDLRQTVGLTPTCWYKLKFEWFARRMVAGELVWSLMGWSELPGRIHVPSVGGDLADMIGDVVATELFIWLGHGPPPSWLPSGGTYYDIDGLEGAVIYSEGQVI